MRSFVLTASFMVHSNELYWKWAEIEIKKLVNYRFSEEIAEGWLKSQAIKHHKIFKRILQIIIISKTEDIFKTIFFTIIG